jgi:hypothetical protein
MSCRSMGRTGVMSDSSAQTSSLLDEARANDLIPVGDPLQPIGDAEARGGGAPPYFAYVGNAFCPEFCPRIGESNLTLPPLERAI